MQPWTIQCLSAESGPRWAELVETLSLSDKMWRKITTDTGSSPGRRVIIFPRLVIMGFELHKLLDVDVNDLENTGLSTLSTSLF